MNLHRSGPKAEWTDISPNKRNTWQHVAAATYGSATPGNFVTLAGFGIAAGGLVAILNGQYGWGLAGLAIGRLLDVIDGWAADKTGTKSPIGEAMDASVDKIITFGTLIVLGLTHLVPWWALACLIAPHVIIVIISGIKFSRGQKLHPSKFGKLSMACSWFALVLFVLAAALADMMGGLPDAVRILAYILTLLALGLGGIAAAGYFADKDAA